MSDSRVSGALHGVLGLVLILCGCSSPPGGLDSPVPVERFNAIARVARDQDHSAIPKLITFLNSDDPIVRLSSIRTLESLTGQTLGYDHAAPEYRRREMVRAWVDWYNQQGPTPTPPQTPGGRGEAGDERVGGAGGGSPARPGPENADTVF